MPQTTQELRDEFADDSVAWAHLTANFAEDRFLIYPKDRSYVLTEKDQRAIQYLIEEWDWDYDPNGPLKSMEHRKETR